VEGTRTVLLHVLLADSSRCVCQIVHSHLFHIFAVVLLLVTDAGALCNTEKVHTNRRHGILGTGLVLNLPLVILRRQGHLMVYGCCYISLAFSLALLFSPITIYHRYQPLLLGFYSALLVPPGYYEGEVHLRIVQGSGNDYAVWGMKVSDAGRDVWEGEERG
jgi:hypothetical protein